MDDITLGDAVHLLDSVIMCLASMATEDGPKLTAFVLATADGQYKGIPLEGVDANEQHILDQRYSLLYDVSLYDVYKYKQSLIALE